MAKPSPSRTSTPTSSPDLHDDAYVNDPGGFVTIPRYAWNTLREHKLTFAQIDYLVVTEKFVRQKGEGCWASTKHIGKTIGVNERNTAAIRAKLVCLGLLIQVDSREENGCVLPVYKTFWSDIGAGRRTPCRARQAPPLSRATDNKDKKNIKTAGDAPCGSPPANQKEKKMPFLVNEKQPTPATPERLARALYQKWQTTPANVRERRKLHHKLPLKTWTADIAQLIKAKWSGGETAVLHLFDRLMKVWEKLPPSVLPFPKDLKHYETYFNRILPAVEQAEIPVVKTCPVHLRLQWEAVSNLNWPGNESLLLPCLVAIDTELAALRSRLLAIRPSGEGRIYNPDGSFTRARPSPVELAAGKLLSKVTGTTAGEILQTLHQTVSWNKDPAFSPKYMSSKYRLQISRIEDHKVVGKWIENSCPDESVRAKLVARIKETE